jgi:uncharacterized protein DUF5678
MLETEFKYYLDHQDELVNQYNGKFIVIKNDSVIGAYNSHSEAYAKATETEALGSFLIQHCTPGKESFSQTFHSQVIIRDVA